MFAQWIQSAHGKLAYGFEVFLSSDKSIAFYSSKEIWLSGWLLGINSSVIFLLLGILLMLLIIKDKNNNKRLFKFFDFYLCFKFFYF